jgi:hypothetical protein
VAELWLVCEGVKGSVDVAILKPILSTILAAEITVEPAGGDRQLSTVAQFLELQRGGKAAYVNDRDYRPRNDAETALRDGTAGFLLRRHSIENYLLPPRMAVSALRVLRSRTVEQFRGQVPQWLADLPADADQIADGLRECARLRSAEEACLLATHRFWSALPSSVQLIQKRIPQTPSASDITDPGTWREALCQEIEKVRAHSESASHCSKFRREFVLPFFDAAYAEVTAQEYTSDMQFLVDFHGRKLLREFYRRLFPHGSRLSFDGLCDELSQAAVKEYEQDRGVYGADDFRDLANGVRSLVGLSPLP